LVHVVYSSLNFRDSRGRLFQYVPLGMEYVGIDANGQRVMGVRDTE